MDYGFGGMMGNLFSGWGDQQGQQAQPQATQTGMPMQLPGAVNNQADDNNKIWQNLGAGRNADGTPNQNQGFDYYRNGGMLGAAIPAGLLVGAGALSAIGGNRGNQIEWMGHSQPMGHLPTEWHFGDSKGLDIQSLLHPAAPPAGLLGRGR